MKKKHSKSFADVFAQVDIPEGMLPVQADGTYAPGAAPGGTPGKKLTKIRSP